MASDRTAGNIFFVVVIAVIIAITLWRLNEGQMQECRDRGGEPHSVRLEVLCLAPGSTR